MLHGYLSCKESFVRQIAFFSRYMRVVAVDMTGFGKAPKLTKAYFLEDYAIEIKDLLDKIGEEKVDLFLQLGVEIFQDHIVDIGAQVANGSVQQVQVVLHAQLLELGAGSGIQLAAVAAVLHVDLVHIVHQLQGLLLADVLVQSAAEIIGDIVFAIGEGTCAAETAHDGAARAVNAGLDLLAVDGTAAVGQSVAGFEDSDLQGRVQADQFVGREDAAGACADDNNVIIHEKFLRGDIWGPNFPF